MEAATTGQRDPHRHQGLDTLGEVMVLATVASASWPSPTSGRLRGAIIAVVQRPLIWRWSLATPLAMVVGIYLLFAGHDQPGGGFGAGLRLRLCACPPEAHRAPQQPQPVHHVRNWDSCRRGNRRTPLIWGDPMLDQVVETVGATPPGQGEERYGTPLRHRGHPSSSSGWCRRCWTVWPAPQATTKSDPRMSIALLVTIGGLTGVGIYLVTSRSLSRIILGFSPRTWGGAGAGHRGRPARKCPDR